MPTAPFLLVDSAEDLDHLLAGALPLSPPSEIVPLFVKPVHEGSSKGITERNFVRNADELEAQVLFLLEKYQQPVLVEEFLPGAEFTCGVLGNGSDARVLPIVGMNFGALPTWRGSDLRLRGEVDLGSSRTVHSISSPVRRQFNESMRIGDRACRASCLSSAWLS